MISSREFLDIVGLTEDAPLTSIIDAFGVHDAYEGDLPYIFISYAHKDSGMVIPAIRALQEEGFPVWYDAGIQAGTEWPAYIARHILKSTLVIVFLTKNAIDSQHCRSEITYAFSKNKHMLTVRLDQAELPEGLEMQLGLSQMFNAFNYRSGEAYINALVQAPVIRQHVKPALQNQGYIPMPTAEERKAAEARRAEEARAAEAARAAEEDRKAEEARQAAEASKAVIAQPEQQEVPEGDTQAAADEERRMEESRSTAAPAPEAAPSDEEARRMEQARIEQEIAAQFAAMMAEKSAGEEKKEDAPAAAPAPAPNAEVDEETARRMEQERIEQEIAAQFAAMMAEKSAGEEKKDPPPPKKPAPPAPPAPEKKPAPAAPEKKSKKPAPPAPPKKAPTDARREALDKIFARITEQLKLKNATGYSNAVKIFNTELLVCTVNGKSCDDLIPEYQKKLSQLLYDDASQLEKNPSTVYLAHMLYKVLPAGYKDAEKRHEALSKQIEASKKKTTIPLTILYIVMNFLMFKFILPGVDGWVLKVLISLVPSIFFMLFQIPLLKKHPSADVMTTYLICGFICAVLDVFLLTHLGFFWRISASLGYNFLHFVVHIILQYTISPTDTLTLDTVDRVGTPKLS